MQSTNIAIAIHWIVIDLHRGLSPVMKLEHFVCIAALLLALQTGAVTASEIADGGFPMAIEAYDGFYDLDSVPEGQPGDLVRIQEIKPFAPHSRAWRVLYLSTSASKNPVVVSGLVGAPLYDRAIDARDIVSWAHGTKGVNDACAPSRGFRISHNFFDIAPEILTEGWIAVATDYEGLGTAGVHPYLVSASEACYQEFNAAVKRRGEVGMRWDLMFSFNKLKHIYQLLASSSVGNKPISIPVLVSQGSADQIVPKYMTDDLVELMCKLGTQVEYLEHPDESHNDSSYLHIGEFREWTGQRFDGVVASGCQIAR